MLCKSLGTLLFFVQIFSEIFILSILHDLISTTNIYVDFQALFLKNVLYDQSQETSALFGLLLFTAHV